MILWTPLCTWYFRVWHFSRFHFFFPNVTGSLPFSKIPCVLLSLLRIILEFSFFFSLMGQESQGKNKSPFPTCVDKILSIFFFFLYQSMLDFLFHDLSFPFPFPSAIVWIFSRFLPLCPSCSLFNNFFSLLSPMVVFFISFLPMKSFLDKLLSQQYLSLLPGKNFGVFPPPHFVVQGNLIPPKLSFVLSKLYIFL